jgi:hypothetical protein
VVNFQPQTLNWANFAISVFAPLFRVVENKTRPNVTCGISIREASVTALSKRCWALSAASFHHVRRTARLYRREKKVSLSTAVSASDDSGARGVSVRVAVVGRCATRLRSEKTNNAHAGTTGEVCG